MKNIQTSRANVFENWRIDNIDKYGVFIWLQLNYIKNGAIIEAVIIELKNNLNPIDSAEKIKTYFTDKGIDSFILDFCNKNNKYYVDDLSRLHNDLNLTLYKNIDNDSVVSSYWDYRLQTRPSNCLTADIDSLEIFNNTFVLIEAAQLFDTANIEEAIKHIFKTFKFRRNQVNPEQYLSHYNFANKIFGKSYILFHKINNNELECNQKCLLIKNDKKFYDMLNNIKSMGRDSMYDFITTYREYLRSSLIQFDDIYKAYEYLNKETLV